MRALGDEELVDAVLDDYRTAPISGRLRATLQLLDGLTMRPEAITAEDIAGPTAADVSDAAVLDAVNVCAAFTILNKLADALGWEPLDEATYRERAVSSLERGYAIGDELLG